jgi:hypothetical protein
MFFDWHFRACISDNRNCESRHNTYSLKAGSRSILIEDVISFTRARARSALSTVADTQYLPVGFQDALKASQGVDRRCTEQATLPPPIK